MAPRLGERRRRPRPDVGRHRAQAQTGLAQTGLALTGLALTGLALTGLALTGLALTGLALTGLVPTGSPAARPGRVRGDPGQAAAEPGAFTRGQHVGEAGQFGRQVLVKGG